MHYSLLTFKGGFDGLQICDVCLKDCNSADGPPVKRRQFVPTDLLQMVLQKAADQTAHTSS